MLLGSIERTLLLFVFTFVFRALSFKSFFLLASNPVRVVLFSLEVLALRLKGFLLLYRCVLNFSVHFIALLLVQLLAFHECLLLLLSATAFPFLQRPQSLVSLATLLALLNFRLLEELLDALIPRLLLLLLDLIAHCFLLSLELESDMFLFFFLFLLNFFLTRFLLLASLHALLVSYALELCLALLLT